MEGKKRKRPNTLKQRIRSWLWKFLMEEPPKASIDNREFARLVKSVDLTTTDDTCEVRK